jgi:hypothetical protein
MSLVEKPYIGVTGISEISEADIVARTFSETLLSTSSHVGMVGYLVSHKTLTGNREGYVKYPQIENLPGLLKVTAPTALNTIHYRTPDKTSLAEQVLRLFDKGNIYADNLCRVLQLNIAWPNINQLERIRTELPQLGLILTLTPRILRKESRFDIEDKLADYKDIVNYVLIDPSGGIRKVFEAKTVLPLYSSIKDIMRNQIVVFTGGFNEINIKPRLIEIAGLIKTKQFGIDAEGGLRESNRDPHAGKLSLYKTVTYLKNAASFFDS